MILSRYRDPLSMPDNRHLRALLECECGHLRRNSGARRAACALATSRTLFTRRTLFHYEQCHFRRVVKLKRQSACTAHGDTNPVR